MDNRDNKNLNYDYDKNREYDNKHKVTTGYVDKKEKVNL